jgi:hypothetical protein
MTITSIVRSNNVDVDGIKQGLFVNANTDYTFTFTISNALASTANFVVILPQDNQAKLVENPTTSLCYIMSGSTEQASPSINCSTDYAKRKVTITGYCTTSGKCNAGSSIAFRLKSDHIMNMGWVRYDTLVLADSLLVRSTTSDGLWYIDGNNVVLASEIINATEGLVEGKLAFPKDEIMRTSNVVNDKITWTLYLKLD